jgi:hypothetical protein
MAALTWDQLKSAVTDPNLFIIALPKMLEPTPENWAKVTGGEGGTKQASMVGPALVIGAILVGGYLLMRKG